MKPCQNSRNRPQQTESHLDRHRRHRAVQARLSQPVHPGRASADAGQPEHGRRSLHLALHAGARGSQQDRGVSRSRPPAAQGGGGLPARRGAGDGQPQGCPRGVGRRDPGDAADAARRGRRRHRRRLSRFAPRSPNSAFPPFTTGRARRPTSRCTRRSKSTCRSAAAMRRCFPATSSWATATA